MSRIIKRDELCDNRTVMTKITVQPPKKPFYMHWHNIFEIIRVTEGTFCISLNGEIYELETNDCLLIFPGCIHDLGLSREQASALIIQFQIPDIVTAGLSMNSSLNMLLHAGHSRDMARFMRRDQPYARQCLFLCDEIHRTAQKEELITDGLVSGAVKMLLEYFAGEEMILTRHRERDGGLDMVKLGFYIDSRELADITLPEVAAYMGYSPKYFVAKFKELTDMTFKQYLDRLKMQEARRMLGEGKSAGEVADRLGFSCVQNFSRAFKNFHHMTVTDMMGYKK